MRLRPQQQPYPPMWYMRNVETAALDGMNTILVGSLDSFEANVRRYQALWAQHHGAAGRTLQGTTPQIGLVNHIVLAPTEAEAITIAQPAWREYVWNLETPRRLEAEKRGLASFLQGAMSPRASGIPGRAAPPEFYTTQERAAEQQRRCINHGGLGGDGRGADFSVLAGTPTSIRTYMDEYVVTGANYFVCSFQWGNLTHEHAMRSLDLFVDHVMPYYTLQDVGLGASV